MDLTLAKLESGVRLLPFSIEAVAWLQTHFDDQAWPAVLSGKAKLSLESLPALTAAAGEAGLRVAVLAA